MEVNILCLVNKSSQKTEAVDGIVILVMWSRLLPKLCTNELSVINGIKATRILTLNRQLFANEYNRLQSNA